MNAFFIVSIEYKLYMIIYCTCSSIYTYIHILHVAFILLSLVVHIWHVPAYTVVDVKHVQLRSWNIIYMTIINQLIFFIMVKQFADLWPKTSFSISSIFLYLNIYIFEKKNLVFSLLFKTLFFSQHFEISIFFYHL